MITCVGGMMIPEKAIKKRPIIFSTDMVKAILDDRKTQTRRVIKPQRIYLEDFEDGLKQPCYQVKCGDGSGLIFNKQKRVKCPYGQVGDRLWVRETWYDDCLMTPSFVGYSTEEYRDNYIYYRADGEAHEQFECLEEGFKWRPSLFMPRWASRITLEITDIRVERLQEIRFRDIEAEGVWIYDDLWKAKGLSISQCRMRFARLWDSLNAKRGYSWESNPWVWVIGFRRLGR